LQPTTHLSTPKGWKAELAWVAGHVMRRFTCPKGVTHPSTNRARCRATALIETNALPYTPNRQPMTMTTFTTVYHTAVFNVHRWCVVCDDVRRLRCGRAVRRGPRRRQCRRRGSGRSPTRVRLWSRNSWAPTGPSQPARGRGQSEATFVFYCNCCAAVKSTIRHHSTGVRLPISGSLRSRWRNSLAELTPTYLFR